MNPAALIQWLMLGSAVLDAVEKTVKGIRALTANGRQPTSQELALLADEVRGDFETLPKPEDL